MHSIFSRCFPAARADGNQDSSNRSGQCRAGRSPVLLQGCQNHRRIQTNHRFPDPGHGKEIPNQGCSLARIRNNVCLNKYLERLAIVLIARLCCLESAFALPTRCLPQPVAGSTYPCLSVRSLTHPLSQVSKDTYAHPLLDDLLPSWCGFRIDQDDLKPSHLAIQAKEKRYTLSNQNLQGVQATVLRTLHFHADALAIGHILLHTELHVKRAVHTLSQHPSVHCLGSSCLCFGWRPVYTNHHCMISLIRLQCHLLLWFQLHL